MKVDEPLCTTCALCAQVCSLVKTGEVNEARSAVRIVRDPFAGREQVLICRSCEERPCLSACALEALGFAGGSIRIDQDRCNLCLACVDACPYGGVQVWRDEAERPLSIAICDGCGGEFPCVPFCTTGALAADEPPTGTEDSNWPSR